MIIPACDQCTNKQILCHIQSFFPLLNPSPCKPCAQSLIDCSFVTQPPKPTPLSTPPAESTSLPHHNDHNEPPLASASKGNALDPDRNTPEALANPPDGPTHNQAPVPYTNDPTLFHFLSTQFATFHKAYDTLTKDNADLSNELRALREELAAVTDTMLHLADDHVCIERRVKLDHAKIGYIYHQCYRDNEDEDEVPDDSSRNTRSDDDPERSGHEDREHPDQAS
uniref:Uncharacterized protein n=1 Tax=Moniliophthora roreri TaxID=221103 RepID=A0A0W0GF68_MONRR